MWHRRCGYTGLAAAREVAPWRFGALLEARTLGGGPAAQWRDGADRLNLETEQLVAKYGLSRRSGCAARSSAHCVERIVAEERSRDFARTGHLLLA